MRSYASRVIFHETAMAVWADAVSLVDRVSDRHDNEVRCHELARAAHTVLVELNQRKLRAANAVLEVVDGKLYAIEHSWLVYRWLDDVAPKRFILDVYCPGRLPQVQLIDGDHFVIARGYEQGACPVIHREMLRTLLAEMTRGK